MNDTTSPSRRSALANGSLLLAASALPAGGVRAAAAGSGTTAAVLDHHLGAFAQGLDEIMKDYGPTSAVLTHDKQYRGPAEIRGFFDAFLKGASPEFWKSFKISAKTIDRDVAYLVWEAKPAVPLATDTLVVRGDKIMVQTFTSAA